MYYDGFDKCGRPVWIMRPRLQNSKDPDRQVKYIVYCLERGIRLMPPRVENLAIIVDFKDSAYAHNPSVATCKKFLDILSNHYPERLGIAFVVKCKFTFQNGRGDSSFKAVLTARNKKHPGSFLLRSS